MNAKCPHCATTDIRIHGSIVRCRERPRFLGLFGTRRPHLTAVGFDASCARCLWAFVIIGADVLDAPSQTAHERLKEADRIVREARKRSHEDNGDAEGARLDRDLRRDPRDEARARRR